MQYLGHHETAVDQDGTHQAAKRVWKEQGSVAKAICVLFAVDYACFLQLGAIPELCRRVFDEELAAGLGITV